MSLPYYLAGPQSMHKVNPATVPDQTWTNPQYALPLTQSWGLDQALNAGRIQAAPQFALNQQTRDQLTNQISLTNASKQAQTGYLQADYRTGLAQNDLSQQSLGIQRGALGRQSPYLDTLHQLAMQGINLNQESTQHQAQIAKRGAVSSAVTRGAINSPGLRQGLSDISMQLENQVSGYNLQRGQENAQYGEKKASLADQNATLDLQARSLNISRDQLKTELDRGLDRLGLSTAMTTADLLARMNSSTIEDQVLAQQVFNAALQSSDYYAQFYPRQSAPTVASGGGSRVRVS